MMNEILILFITIQTFLIMFMSFFTMVIVRMHYDIIGH